MTTVQYPVPFRHGFAVIDREGRSLFEQGDVHQVFTLASVTKLLTGLAAHRAVQAGYLRLDQPAGPPGSTLRHLLSHASGLAPEGDGQTAIALPQQTRIYSNQGYEVVQGLLEESTQRPLQQWLFESVLAPLGAEELQVHGSAAHSGLGNVAQMALIAQELLSPRLLSLDSLRNFSTPVFPTLRGILPGYGMARPNGWGMGAEVRGQKSPHWTAPGASLETFGHFGVSGSFLWVDPPRGLAAIFLGEQPFGPWHKQHWPSLSQMVLDAL